MSRGPHLQWTLDLVSASDRALLWPESALAGDGSSTAATRRACRWCSSSPSPQAETPIKLLSPDSGALDPRPSGRATLRYVPVAFCAQHHTQSTSCHSCGPASKLAGCSCPFFSLSLFLAWARQFAESVSANESPERNGPEPSTALPSPRSRALSGSRPSRYTSARVITSSTSTLCCEPVGPRHLPKVVPAGGLSTDGSTTPSHNPTRPPAHQPTSPPQPRPQP